jgi:hypothetical protein
MWIDYIYFGYGAGLVLVGWFLGMCISVVFKVVGRIGSICVLFFFISLFSSFVNTPLAFAGVTAPVSCTTGKDTLLTFAYSSAAPGLAATNRDSVLLPSTPPGEYVSYSLKAFCVDGSLSVVYNVDDLISLVSNDDLSPIIDYQQIVSLLTGGFFGMAFCLAFNAKM